MASSQHSDGRPDGQVLGQSASDLVAFHGATPSVQGTFVASAGSKAASSAIIVASLSGFVFANSSAAAQVLTILETVRTLLISKGLMASS